MSQPESRTASSGGISIVGIVGCALAAYCSWTLNHSVGWAAVHAIFGWLYMLYICLGCGGGLPPGLF